jgi:tetratricopeptide (TPR) repeat protein
MRIQLFLQPVLPCSLLLLPLIVGCAGMEDRTEQGMQAGHEEVRKAAEALLAGIRLYENGHFEQAIAKLREPALQAAPEAMRVEALKYTAFSYCVIERYPQCRDAFDQSLAIDSDFELRKSERGHPMWGPVFEEAKAASEENRTYTPVNRNRERWRGIDLWRAR